MTAIRFGEYSLQESLEVAKKNLATFKGGLKPSLGFSASLALSFNHTGVFRVVVVRAKREIENSVSLWLVKGSTSVHRFERILVLLDLEEEGTQEIKADLCVNPERQRKGSERNSGALFFQLTLPTEESSFLTFPSLLQ